jgi:His/Glu/Gln/Arg/opine family amino acid ABC transporter permease subunit
MLQGAIVTLKISLCAMAVAAGVGVVLGLIGVSDLTLLKMLVRGYVYFLRGMPALVQIFLVYFALPRRWAGTAGVTRRLPFDGCDLLRVIAPSRRASAANICHSGVHHVRCHCQVGPDA